MNAERFFKIKENNTTYEREILAGITTFFTMSYIIFVNPAILSEAGMSYEGVFVATILVSALSTLFMALFANSPFAIAPGMGTNAFVAYTMCLGLNFHWKEAMAITFLTGILYLVSFLTGFRKEIVKAIPDSLKFATTAGIGFFIVYIGLKNTGLLSFTLSPGQYTLSPSGAAFGSQAIQGLISNFTATHCLAVLGLFLLIALLVLEKKNKERYGSFIIVMIVLTFVGIPLGVTKIESLKLFDVSSLFHLKDVAFSFFGDPGLLSVFSNPVKALLSVMMIIILLMSNILDAVAFIVGVGQMEESPIFTKEDIHNFETEKGVSSKLDRALIANSAAGSIASVFGTTAATTYSESITGITAGGKTGLTALVVAALFLLCLPLSNFFAVIPSVASAPMLMASGVFMIILVKNINWSDFEESVPCVLIISLIPLTFSILNGIIAGYIAYAVICAVNGELRKVHPIIYVLIFLFITVIILRTFFEI